MYSYIRKLQLKIPMTRVGYQLIYMFTSSMYTTSRSCCVETMKQTNTVQSSSSSSRMHVINHNWSATKQCLHLQSVAEISRHSVLSGDKIQQCGTSSGSRHKYTDQCL